MPIEGDRFVRPVAGFAAFELVDVQAYRVAQRGDRTWIARATPNPVPGDKPTRSWNGPQPSRRSRSFPPAAPTPSQAWIRVAFFSFFGSSIFRAAAVPLWRSRTGCCTLRANKTKCGRLAGMARLHHQLLLKCLNARKWFSPVTCYRRENHQLRRFSFLIHNS